MLYSYQDNTFVPTSEVSIKIVDDIVGTIRGYRIFTACRTVHKTTIFHVDDHIERLFHSAEKIHMELPVDRSELKEILYHVVAKNASAKKDLLLEVMFTGGRAMPNGIAPKGPATLIVLTFAMKMPPKSWYAKGITLATYPHQRTVPSTKLMFYIGAVMAHQTVVKERNADEALFVDPGDCTTILEGTTFNVFVVDSNNTIVTPRLNKKVLAGITRRVTMGLSKIHPDFVVEEEKITLDDLKDAKEMFLTSSTRNVVPIVQVDDILIGDGTVGTVTQQGMKYFEEYQSNYLDER